MDIKQLETFVSVCKRKSFSTAAKELYITQPTVTNHIQSLEDELDTSLIIRSSRNITLTPQGEMFFAFAQKTLAEKNKMCDSISEMAGDSGGVIEIVSSTVPEVYLLPKIIKQFISIYPNALFKVHHRDSSNVIEELEDKNYNLGFSGHKKVKSSLIYNKIAKDKLVIIEGKNAGFINKISSYIDANLIKDLPLICREEGSGSKSVIFRSLLGKKNINIVAEVETDQLIKQMVLHNIGISIISINSISAEEKPLLNIYEIENNPLARDLYFVYNPSSLLSVMEEKFKTMCINAKF